MKIYHYTKLDTAITKILPTMQLKFNKVGLMNDPVENLQHIIDEKELVPSDDEFNLAYDNFVKDYQKKWQVLSFSKDYSVKKKGFCLQQMWTHYGDKNKGVCFQFDLDKLIESNSKIIKHYKIKNKSVKYKDGILKAAGGIFLELKWDSDNFIVDNTEKINSDSSVKDRLFTKNSEWKYESEYRFVANSSEEIYLNINDSFEYLYLGLGVNRENLTEILKILKKEQLKKIILEMNSNLVSGKINYEKLRT